MTTPRESQVDRRRWRRRLLLAGLLPLAVALLFAAKVVLMLGHDSDGRASYGGGEFDDAGRSFAANAFVNLLETWLSPFGEGTARHRLGDYPGAVASLQTALNAVPSEQECLVRINLALSHEALGDAASIRGERRAATSSWRAGVRVLAAGGCLEEAEDQEKAQDRRGREAEDDPAEEAEDDRAREADAEDQPEAAEERRARVAAVVDRRLREKLRESPDAVADPHTQELEERNDRGERQRQKVEQRQQDRQDQQEVIGEGEGEGPQEDYEW